ncbi:MAG: peptidase [Bacilli bacterium]|nr:peptidase [Bacilli bacterium]
MVFKGRIVLAFVILAMFASSLLTITFFNPNIQIVQGNISPSKGSPPLNAAGLTTQDMKKLETAYDLIHTQYVFETDHDKIMDGAINGMLTALEDPFSSYMNAEENKQFQESVDAFFEGIGAEVSLKDGKLMIISPIKGSPAEKAGLRVNDIVASVNGEKLDGLTLSQAVAKIRGKKGTQAKLSIVRSEVVDPIDVIVVRDDIQMVTVHGQMITTDIGKIEIRQFSANTEEEFKTELVSLEGKGMKGLIIDVRNDPGGYLQTVIHIAEPFIEKGKTIVQTEDRQGKRKLEVSANKEPVRKFPIAVLINKGSASAAEILAGALQQSAGSQLIGETTYGKGTVQDTFDKELGDGSNLKLTVNKWLTPDGTWIHKKGIAPDLSVAQPDYFKVEPLTKKVTLKYDMNNDDVKNMQIMLTGLGIIPDRIDGYFSQNTMEALKSFQQMYKLPITGEADVNTMNQLEDEVKLKIQDPKNDAQLNEAISSIQKKLLAR